MSSGAPNPVPISRELNRVLRKQLGSGGGLRLIIAEALDSTGLDASYTNVRIAGVDYTVPKLDVGVSPIPTGRSVYILADSYFNSMIAVGSVRG